MKSFLMPKRKREEAAAPGHKRVKKDTLKRRLVREHREKIKALKKDLRNLERDLRSLTGRRRKRE
jgi:hypothetical protein